MNPKHNIKSYLFFLTALILIEIPCFLCQDSLYQTCSQPFQCGNIGEIGYPFFGGNRPSSCGYPGFELDCRSDDDAPLISIQSLRYRVVDINNTTQTVRVARDDLSESPCTTDSRNTTINFQIFDYSSNANDRNITLFYDCSTLPVPNPHQYSCSGNRIGSSWIYATGDQPLTGAVCRGSFFVTVNQTAEGILADPASSSRDVLADALASGFSMEWSANNSNCVNCVGSGGVCGYEQSTSSFACYCSDRSYALTCGNRNGGNSSTSQWRTLGFPLIGAALAGLGLGFLIYFCVQKRKNKLLARSSQVVSKEITPPPSSNGPLTPSTVSTKSIPSLPSSKSNFSRHQESAYFGVQVFSYTELEEATDSFNDSKELGEGGFGRVYYGVLSDGRIVAVKRLYENNFKRVEQFMNEVEILTRLRHENLVLLHGCTSKRSRELLLVYEYIPNGTVACHLFGNRAKSGMLSWPVRLNIAVESASALAYLHKSDIIHRDVKTNNILLDNDFHVKVADFGLSRLFPTDVTHVSTAPQGTPGYVDPEYYQCYHLTEKSDVYSFGVVLIELISSLPAVDTNRHRHDINLANMAVNKIQNHVLHELVDPTLGFETDSAVRRMTTLVAELAFRCLQQERDMRPSMNEVLEALKGIQNEDFNAHKVDIVDISMDEDAALLKGSGDTDSEATDKWTSGSNSNPNSIV